MLRFILGTAGTGKTVTLMEEIVEKVQGGEKAILLVPEQFSFETERELFRALGAKKSLSVEVLSFTRLCNNIFREYGGLAGTVVTPVGKYLLMSVAVSELTDQLQTYRKSAQNIDFLETLLSASTEFKTAGITPEVLTAYAETLDGGRLGDKLHDLSLLYTAYQGLLEQGYLDPDDDIIRACALLEGNNYFQEYHVYVDGFTTFMAGEFELLGHIIAQAKSATFAMTADRMIDRQQGVGVFSTVQKAISSLVHLAEISGTPVESPTVLEEPKRYKSADLAHLSKEFLSPVPKPYNQIPVGIHLASGQDMYQEVQQIAVEIETLVQEKGYRYQDIAVVAREHTQFLRVIELVFGRYGIPFFDDRTLDVENTPLIFGILAAVEAVRSNFAGENMLFLAKSPIMGYDAETVALLENYHYVWRPRGAQWELEFKNHPRGLVEETSLQDIKTLEKINSIRERIITPLTALKKAMATGVAEDFAAGIYTFLLQVEVRENLLRYAATMPSHEGEQFLEENAGLWDSVMDVLDVFGDVLGGRALGRNRLSELFSLALTASELGTIPQTLDQVLVGAANRIRPWNKKAVFVLGANEGIFPPTLHTTGVFSDTEREKLIEAGLELAPGGFHQSVLERFFAYFAVTLPSEFLMVSYAKADLQGRELLPSVIVSQLKEIFPQLGYQSYPPEAYILNDSSAFAALAQNYQEDSVLTASLLEYFTQKNLAGLSRIQTAAERPVYEIENTTVARELFGERMHFSPSRVERYHSCPFRYFMQDGLRLRKRQRAEFSPLESGSLIHYVLEVMVEKYGKKLADKTVKELEEEVTQLINEYLESRIEQAETFPVRFQYLFSRLCVSLAELLSHLGKEFSQSDFEPVAFELEIGWDKEVAPLEFRTKDGIPVTVDGIVDRVDSMELDGITYLRVVDYKSGGKDFDLADVMHGINLQMLLYLFTLEEHWKKQGEKAVPAGVLYLPVLENYINTQREDLPEETRKKREKQWTMSGLLLEQEESLRGMEQSLEGLFIPVWKNKDGSYSAYSSIASYEQMGQLSQKIEELIVSMAENLAEGKIPAYPIDTAQYPTCDYCEYRKVCGYETGDPVREISKKDRRTILKELEEQNNV